MHPKAVLLLPKKCWFLEAQRWARPVHAAPRCLSARQRHSCWQSLILANTFSVDGVNQLFDAIDLKGARLDGADTCGNENCSGNEACTSGWELDWKRGGTLELGRTHSCLDSLATVRLIRLVLLDETCSVAPPVVVLVLRRRTIARPAEVLTWRVRSVFP